MMSSLLLPVFAMLLLTFCVWFVMAKRRLGYILSNRIHPQSLKTQPEVEERLPPEVQYAAYNLNNLSELPIVFYVVCLLLLHLDMVTTIDVVLAWAFVLGRVVHSVIHCTSNRVISRFRAYALSSIVLWILVFYAMARVVYLALS